jgi:hypothetical protein
MQRDWTSRYSLGKQGLNFFSGLSGVIYMVMTHVGLWREGYLLENYKFPWSFLSQSAGLVVPRGGSSAYFGNIAYFLGSDVVSLPKRFEPGACVDLYLVTDVSGRYIGSIFRSQVALLLKLEPIGFPETSVINCNLRNPTSP